MLQAFPSFFPVRLRLWDPYFDWDPLLEIPLHVLSVQLISHVAVSRLHLACALCLLTRTLFVVCFSFFVFCVFCLCVRVDIVAVTHMFVMQCAALVKRWLEVVSPYFGLHGFLLPNHPHSRPSHLRWRVRGLFYWFGVLYLMASLLVRFVFRFLVFFKFWLCIPAISSHSVSTSLLTFCLPNTDHTADRVWLADPCCRSVPVTVVPVAIGRALLRLAGLDTIKGDLVATLCGFARWRCRRGCVS